MRPHLLALAKKRPDGTTELRSPSVGLWRDAPPEGSLLRPGMTLGALELLGRLFDLRVPEGAAGILLPPGATPRFGGSLGELRPHDEPGARPRLALDAGARSRLAVGYGDLLGILDPENAGQLAKEQASTPEHRTSGMVFESPMSGRFYRRAAPDKPAFVEVGDEVGLGQTICLLEVMKTFNRITYGGGGHPERARVLRVIPADGDDLAAGDPILELQPI